MKIFLSEGLMLMMSTLILGHASHKTGEKTGANDFRFLNIQLNHSLLKNVTNFS